jgi:beta-aspartyl-peptidase (threonine type)
MKFKTQKVLPAVFLAIGITVLPAAFSQGTTEIPDVGAKPDWVIAIHGGAGNTTRANLSAEKEAQSRAGLEASLAAGAEVLRAGGTGPEAIEAALKVLEDHPLFNAGHGAVLDETGNVRHDASIMRGEDHAAGGIAGSSRIRNPIAAARAVMEQTKNVLLHGDGADWFAAENGLELADPLYFITEERRQQLMKKRAAEPGTVASEGSNHSAFGTVGAVVLDSHGNLSAGTSTGGRSNKRFGRVGDTPIIGAGTYASNESCAVSGTGHGEYFMRWTAARDICARVEFAGESLEQAAEALIVDTMLPVEGYGAVIAMDPSGKVVFVSTTANLKRGVMSSTNPAQVAVYTDEDVAELD